ncbi:hypothetical protein [Pseudoalteromonas sp. JC3]|uniref:hypothetical protein n=1 Tax=Pseudoalteromonas sp. JC3 TaxID=2810196 RepID=UPI0019CFE038|nr:hypothetical protein [Pseudoalteromonas sp. JC3]MBR8843423.1 hypothetical protein [Pseudoalteromonas sp. JC3]WJE11366.1 hypothetical protein QSH61_19775 [Pseudoalteromonas sp. JC3]
MEHLKFDLDKVPELTFKHQSNYESNIPNTLDLRMLDEVSAGNTFLRLASTSQNPLVTVLDEKPSDNSFSLVGITTLPMYIPIMASKFRDYKKELIPDLDPNNWYIKADGKYLFKDSRVIGVGQKKDDAIARWVLFSSFLDHFRKYYCLHISYLKKDDPSFQKIKRKKVIPKYYESTFRGIKESLQLFGGIPSDIIFDNLDSNCFRKIQNDKYNDSFINSIQRLPKDDFKSDMAQIMQFVDMLTYICSRFLFPPNSLAVLLDFEKYSIGFSSDLYMRYKGYSPSKTDVCAHMVLSNILHQLRFSILDRFMLNDGNIYGSVKKYCNEEYTDLSGKVVNSMISFSNLNVRNLNSLKSVFFESDFN